MKELALATRNPGKLKEFRELLAPARCRIFSLSDLNIDVELEETGTTFAENARLKALACSNLTALPVLADDSGLVVEALGGRPGIHSARYAGPGASDADRIGKLLGELENAETRQAKFVCALALVQGGTVLLETEGECHGIIADEPRGDNGFGYDPVFLFPEFGRTYAELTEEEKNRCSHRARAVASLLRLMAPR